MSRLTKTDDTEDIIANSIEIYEKELNLSRKGNNYVGLCPLHGEKTPSFNINSNYPYIFKCFGCEEKGNVITFISKLHNITYSEAISYILNSNIDLKPSTKPIIKEKKELIIDFVDKPFDAQAKKYWGEYELPEDFLRKNNVFQVKIYAINKKIIKHSDDRVIFAYLNSEGGVKLLNIGENVPKSEKWKSNVKSDYLWYLPKTSCKQLWVVKSIKDALCLKYHFNFFVTAVQSENATVLDKNMPRILQVSNDIVINFGADTQGVNSCIPVQQKWKTKYFNTPKSMLKYGLVDCADVISAYGVKNLEKQLKNKGFL